MSTAVAAKPPSTGPDVQPQSSALTSASASAPIATVKTAAPRMSGRASARTSAACAVVRSSGRTRRPAISAMAMIGTFTRNTQCQLASTSAPPTTGPRAAAAPPTEVQARIAPVRRSAGAARQQQAERGRHEQGAAGRLDDPGADENPDVRRGGAAGGGDREDDHAGQERGPAADQVGRPA